MKVKVEQISPCQVKLEVTVETEEFQKGVEEALNETLKDFEADGFRKGKMPKDLYLKKYGEQSVYSKAIDEIINATYAEAITKKKIRVVNYPDIKPSFEGLDKKKFSYVATVDIYPEVTLGEYKGLNIKQDAVKVTKKDVEKHIEGVLSGKAELEVVEGRALQNGDTVVFDFEGFVDNVAFEGGKAENYSLEIGSHQFIPGFEEQMVGLNAGDSKDINVKFPEEYHAEELKGKDAVFKIKLHEIKQKVLPTLDDDFVKELEISEIETVEAYKKDVEDKLLKERQEASENKYLNDVLKAVCKNAKTEIPQCMVDEEVASYVRRLEGQAKQYGLTVDQFLSFQGTTLDKLKEMITPDAKKRVLEDVVLGEVAKAEKLSATAKEVKDKYAELAEAYGQKVEDIKTQIAEDNVKAYIINLKTIELLKKENAVLK